MPPQWTPQTSIMLLHPSPMSCGKYLSPPQYLHKDHSSRTPSDLPKIHPSPHGNDPPPLPPHGNISNPEETSKVGRIFISKQNSIKSKNKTRGLEGVLRACASCYKLISEQTNCCQMHCFIAITFANHWIRLSKEKKTIERWVKESLWFQNNYWGVRLLVAGASFCLCSL